MYGNFIYFIIVLLIYATYQPSETTNFTFLESGLLFIGLVLFFCVFSWLLFKQLRKRIGRDSSAFLDHLYTNTQFRLSVMAVLFFVVNIYGLNITDFLSRLPLMKTIPTFQAIICLIVFIGYLSIMWGISYSTYRRLYPSPVDKRSYILSNISFAAPILMPWIILSLIADIIHSMPFEPAREFLTTVEGQLFYFLVFMSLLVLIGPAMVQRFWRCRPLPPSPARERIEGVCRKANVLYRNIVEWPIFRGHMITAGVMGLVKRFRYILVTPALLRYLSPEELDAVIAHEIGHVKKNHLLFYLFFFTGYMLIAYTTFDVIVYFILYSKPVYIFVTAAGYDQAALPPVLFSIVMIVFFLIYFRYIFGYFMRNFERQADAYAFSMFNTAAPLVSTFKKIAYASGQSADKPNWHHFSIVERINFLQSCESDRSLIVRHNRKVFRSIVAFFFALTVMGWVGYQLNFGDAGETINSHFLEKILYREIEKAPDNSQLYAILGDLYYSRNNYGKTIESYERAIAITTEFPHVLNNLAWLYATCDDAKYRNAQRALLLARQAAILRSSPEILDTLAESYYINGEYDKAIEIEKKALELGDNNRGYYKSQLEKFMKKAGSP